MNLNGVRNTSKYPVIEGYAVSRIEDMKTYVTSLFCGIWEFIAISNKSKQT